MSRIAIDIDDTLYPFATLARAKFCEFAIERGEEHLKRGAYMPWTEFRSPADVLGMDYWMEIISACHAPEVILAQAPLPGAVDTMWDLRDEGHDLTYITDRNPATYDVTLQWLTQCGFPLPDADDGVKFLCGRYPTKATVLHDCQYIIDDRPKTLVQFVYDFDWQNKHGSQDPDSRRLAFGIFHEHNRSLTDVPGVYLAPNWVLLREYLIEKGVLCPR